MVTLLYFVLLLAPVSGFRVGVLIRDPATFNQTEVTKYITFQLKAEGHIQLLFDGLLVTDETFPVLWFDVDDERPDLPQSIDGTAQDLAFNVEGMVLLSDCASNQVSCADGVMAVCRCGNCEGSTCEEATESCLAADAGGFVCSGCPAGSTLTCTSICEWPTCTIPRGADFCSLDCHPRCVCDDSDFIFDEVANTCVNYTTRLEDCIGDFSDVLLFINVKRPINNTELIIPEAISRAYAVDPANIVMLPIFRANASDPNPLFDPLGPLIVVAEIQSTNTNRAADLLATFEQGNFGPLTDFLPEEERDAIKGVFTVPNFAEVLRNLTTGLATDLTLTNILVITKSEPDESLIVDLTSAIATATDTPEVFVFGVPFGSVTNVAGLLGAMVDRITLFVATTSNTPTEESITNLLSEDQRAEISDIQINPDLEAVNKAANPQPVSEGLFVISQDNSDNVLNDLRSAVATAYNTSPFSVALTANLNDVVGDVGFLNVLYSDIIVVAVLFVEAGIRDTIAAELAQQDMSRITNEMSEENRDAISLIVSQRSAANTTNGTTSRPEGGGTARSSLFITMACDSEEFRAALKVAIADLYGAPEDRIRMSMPNDLGGVLRISDQAQQLFADRIILVLIVASCDQSSTAYTALTTTGISVLTDLLPEDQRDNLLGTDGGDPTCLSVSVGDGADGGDGTIGDGPDAGDGGDGSNPRSSWTINFVNNCCAEGADQQDP